VGGKDWQGSGVLIIIEPIMKRIFVVGCGRSGTTLMQAILNGDRSIVSWRESHLLTRCIEEYDGVNAHGPALCYRVRDGVRVLAECLRWAHKAEFPTELVMDIASYALDIRPNTPVDKFTEYVIKAFDNVAKYRDPAHRHWVERTALNVFRLEAIKEAITDGSLLVIQMVRRPSATIPRMVALAQQGHNAFDWNTAIYYWRRSSEIALERDHRTHKVVMCEGLHRDPVGVMRQILSLVHGGYGVELTERANSVLGSYIHFVDEIISEDEHWKQSVRNPMGTYKTPPLLEIPDLYEWEIGELSALYDEIYEKAIH